MCCVQGGKARGRLGRSVESCFAVALHYLCLLVLPTWHVTAGEFEDVHPLPITGLAVPATNAEEQSTVVDGPPVVETFMPKAGFPGNKVGLLGSNLVAITSIQFNAIEASFTEAINFLPVTATVPTNATTGPITVTTSRGSFTTKEPFVIVEAMPPVITGFSPTNGPPGTLVELFGRHLAGIVSVEFNGVEAIKSDICPVEYPCPQAEVPRTATTGPIKVTTRYGSYMTSDPFVVTALPGPPVISSFAPRHGPATTRVVIFGSNLIHIAGITFNGTQASIPPSSESVSCSTSVPFGATTGPITLTTETGTYTSLESFVVEPGPEPLITGFSPEIGRQDTRVVITGTNLAYLKSVQFSGVPCHSYFSLGDETVYASLPFCATGPITVITFGGQCRSTNLFTVLGGPPAPIVQTFSPAQGPSGLKVKISGANFSRITKVMFHWRDAEFSQEGNDVIALVPSGFTSGPVVLTSTYGQAVSSQVFSGFNTGELSLSGRGSVDPLIWGQAVKVSFFLTNPTPVGIEDVYLTNTFGFNPPPMEPVVWTNDAVLLNAPATTSVAVQEIGGSFATHTLTDGAVVSTISRLDPGKGVQIHLSLKLGRSGLLHTLAFATGRTAKGTAVQASAIVQTAVSDRYQLFIQRLSLHEIEIVWPASESIPVLQTTDKLLGSAIWSDVSTSDSLSEGRHRLILPVDTSHDTLYRLLAR